jgi:hypothetical protein
LQAGIPIAMQDAVLSLAELRDYAETSPTVAVGGGAVTLDFETGNVFEVTLTEDVTSMTLANPPAAGRAGSCILIVKQDATGGRTLAWPASVRWAGGLGPVVSNGAGALDVFSLVTRDGGVTWLGFPAGKDFS